YTVKSFFSHCIMDGVLDVFTLTSIVPVFSGVYSDTLSSLYEDESFSIDINEPLPKIRLVEGIDVFDCNLDYNVSIIVFSIGILRRNVVGVNDKWSGSMGTIVVESTW